MDLKFSNLILFESIKKHADQYPDLEKGGIYVAFAITCIDGKIDIEQKPLYIGKADDSSNSLGKRIKEHGDKLEGQDSSDHNRWRRNGHPDKYQKIAYCFAPMDDMTHIEDIEKKLIWLNKPYNNSHNKDRDNSRAACPTIYIETPFPSNLEGYINTLEQFLDNASTKQQK